MPPLSRRCPWLSPPLGAPWHRRSSFIRIGCLSLWQLELESFGVRGRPVHHVGGSVCVLWHSFIRAFHGNLRIIGESITTWGIEPAMRLKMVAISDTHLGDSVSLLSSPRGRRHLAETLRRQFGPQGELEVEELILVGDILERVFSPLPRVLNHARDFIETLRGVAAIERIVYLVGDHDHLLWTAYRRPLCGEDNPYGITPPSGDPLVERGCRRDGRESATELLSIFFGYPSSPLWKERPRPGWLRVWCCPGKYATTM